MHKVGELLKKKRLELKLDFTDVERETRIKDTFIKYLEEGEYDKLPGPSYAQGFLKNYADFLGLDTNVILALFRREYDAKREQELLPGRLGSTNRLPVKRTRFTVLALTISALTLVLVSYFIFQYKDFLGSPALTLTTPRDGETVEGDSLTVIGRTDPDAVVSVNDKAVTVGDDGAFEYSIPVWNTEFTITVVAKNRNGRETKIIRQIKVKSPT